MEQRTLFAGFAATLVAPVPGLAEGNFNNAMLGTPLLRDPSTGQLIGYDPLGGDAKVGIVYTVDPIAKTLTTITNFVDGPQRPIGLVMDSQGNLFGVTQLSSDPTGNPVLFEISKADRSTATTLYTFSDNAIGRQPISLLVDGNDNLVVLTSIGGANGGGSILRFLPNDQYATPSKLGDIPTPLQAFASTLVMAPSGAFYGTTANGGANGAGTIFELPAGSSTVSTVASFDSATTGNTPNGSLFVDAQGKVYGTTHQGTSSLYGAVWEFDPTTDALSTIATFALDKGIFPESGIVGDASGNMYGVAQQGGTNNAGSFFKIDASTHAISFTTLDDTALGFSPFSAPTADGSGNFYMVTDAGGANNRGAVIKIAPSNGGGGGGGGGSGTVTLAPTVNATLPAAVVAGEKVKGSVAVDVTNSGSGALNGPVTVTLYASADTTLDDADVAIGVPLVKKLKLAAGASKTLKVKLSSLPTVADGSYHVIAKTTADGATQGEAASSTSVNIAAPFVDLSGSFVSSLPASVAAGAKGSLAISVTNNGNVPVKNPIDVGLFAGTSQTRGTGDVALPNGVAKLNLKPGASKTIKLKIVVPASLASGSYVLLAQLDSVNAVTESDEANNLVVSSAATNVTAAS